MSGSDGTWFSQLEQRRGRALFAMLLVVIATLAVSSMRDPYSFDSFWHLKMGQDWLEQGLSPFTDHYSITHHGEAIQSPPILFQAILYKTVDLFGVGLGYKLLVFAASVLSVVMMMVWLNLIRAPTYAVLLALPMLVVALQVRAFVRPEILAYPLLILSLILYERVRLNPEPKRLWPIALLMLFFTNYHSAVLGYVIFFGLFVDLGLQQLKARAPLNVWVTWASWGVVIVAVGFANPSFLHPVVQTFAFSNEWFGLIGEYRAPWNGNHWPASAAIISLSVITVCLLLYQRFYGYALVCFVLALYALRLERIVTPAGVVTVALFALALRKLEIDSLLKSGTMVVRSIASSALAILFIAALLTSIMKARALVHSNSTLVGYFPDQLVEYMKATGKHGRIFNDYEVGGYLIYHLGDKSRVFTDGRSEILYPVEHIRRWQEIRADPKAFVIELDKHQIDFVVLNNKPSATKLMGEVPSMKLDYADFRYSLYVRGEANFPVSGALWSKPWCWNEEMAGSIQDERIKALFTVPQYSLLVPLTNMVADFAIATDRSTFIEAESQKSASTRFDATSRFAGYRAMELQRFDLALKFFPSVFTKEAKDYLAMGFAAMRLGHLSEAEHLFRTALPLVYLDGDAHQYRLIHALLVELQNEKPLELIPQTVLDSISERISNPDLHIPHPMTAQMFCNKWGRSE